MLEARLGEDVLAGLSTILGEYLDCSAHPSSEGSICSREDEAFDAMLLCHALADRIGLTAETVRQGVVLTWNLDHRKVQLGQGLMPSSCSGGWS